VLFVSYGEFSYLPRIVICFLLLLGFYLPTLQKGIDVSGILYILRGVPGCGKSTVAKNLTANGVGVICEADNYFISDVDGVYRFDAKKLGLAHGWCNDICRNALEAKIPVVVVSNTNVNPKDFQPYEKMAKDYGYTVFHLVVENRHGGKDSHNVPEEALVRMKGTLEDTIKLR